MLEAPAEEEVECLAPGAAPGLASMQVEASQPAQPAKIDKVKDKDNPKKQKKAGKEKEKDKDRGLHGGKSAALESAPKRRRSGGSDTGAGAPPTACDTRT